nr:ankyrin repeat domain-containing protein 26-like isoform X3 [Microcebus murinus]
MKKFFAFGREKGKGESPFFGSMWKAVVGARDEIPEKAYTKTWYDIYPKDLEKFHLAACLGHVAKLQDILSFRPMCLNDRDWKSRTALHLACATGQAEVVRFLVNSKCRLNLFDSKKRTALMKAVQCQEEECVTVLLEGGAKPNIQDVYGNTALHYAVYQQDVSIAEKLLSNGAFIDPQNKSHITPLLLAVSEKREEMVDFLVKAGANINAVDKLKRNALMLATDSQSPHIINLLQQSLNVCSDQVIGQTVEDDTVTSGFNSISQQISQHEEEKILENPSQISNPVMDEIAEDPMFRISIKPGIDDFWPDSFAGHFDVDTKNVLQTGLTKPLTASQHTMKIVEVKCTMRTKKRTMIEDSISNHPHVVQSLPTTSVKMQGFHHPSIQPPGPGVKASFKASAKPGLTEKERAKPATAKKENGIGVIENVPPEQKNNVNFIVMHKNRRSDKRCTLGSGSKKDEESSWDSDDENVPQPGLTKPMTASQETMKIGTKCTMRTKKGTMIEDSISNLPHVVQRFPTTSVKMQGFHHPSIQPPGPGVKASFKSSTKPGLTEDERATPSTAKQENGIGVIENAHNVNFTVMHEYIQSDKRCTLGSGPKEDEESSWDSDDENVPQPGLTKPLTVSQQPMKIEAQCTMRTVNRTMIEDSISNHLHVVQRFPTTSVKMQGFHHPSIQPPGPGVKASFKSSTKPGLTEEERAKPATAKQENGIGVIEHAPREQKNNVSFNVMHENSRSDKRCTLGSGPKEDEESPWDSDDENVPQSGLTKPMIASQQPLKIVKAQCTMRTENGTMIEDSISNHPHVVQRLRTTSVKMQGFHHPSFQPPGTGEKTSFKASTKPGLTEEERAKPATAKQENVIGVIENAPREQKNNVNFTVMHEYIQSDKRCTLGSGPKEDEESPWDSDDEEGTANPSTTKKENGIGIIENALQVQNTSGSFTAVCHHNRSDMMSALVSGENEVVEVPLDSSCESISKNPLQKHVVPSSGTVDKKGRNTVNGQIEGSYHKNLSSSPHSDRASKVYLKEELQQDMQKFKNEVDMLQVEFLAVEKEKVLLEKEVEEGRKEHKSNEMEVSENLYTGAANISDNEGSFEQRKRGRTGPQHFLRKEDKECDSSGSALHIKEVKKNGNEKRISNKSAMTAMFEKPKLLTGGLLPANDDSSLCEIEQDEGRPPMKTSNKKNKVKHKIHSVDDIDDLTGSSAIAPEDGELPYSDYKQFMLLIKQLGKDCKDSVSLMKIRHAFLSRERIIEVNKNYCERLRLKLEKTGNKVGILQKELSKTEEIKSHLEHQEVIWEHELCSARFTLKEEEEKRRNIDMLYKQMRKKLRRKEEEYRREDEVKQQLEPTLKKQNEELQTLRAYLSQISHSQEREKDLLHKNRMLQEQIAMLRMERDKIKNQNEENEKKYLKDMVIKKEKDDDVQINIILNSETLTKTGSHYGEQLRVLTAENAMLKCKLERETQIKERLKEEIEFYHSRLTATTRDLDESETLREHLELAFHTARDEWFHLQDKMNFYVSNLKESNEILSKKFSKTESKINSLEMELHHTRELLREKTFLKGVQRDLRQTQCQTKEIEQTYHGDQGKVNPYIGKKVSLEQRLCELQKENMLLRQQLHAVHKKAAQKDEIGTHIQDQCQDIMKQSQAGSGKQSLLLEGKLQELVNECDHLKERMCHLEKESAERKVLVRHLHDLTTTLKKQPRSETFAEVSPRHINLEDGTPGSMKILRQIRSQTNQLKQALEFPCSKCGHLYTKNRVVQPESLSNAKKM